jgi:hypothetical protein
MYQCLVAFVLMFAMVFVIIPLAEAQQLQVKVMTLTSPVKRGAVVRLAVHTSPGAQCTPVLELKPGKSSALGKKTADRKGTIQWGWMVRKDTIPGNVPLTITCTLKNKVGAVRTSIVVR